MSIYVTSSTNVTSIYTVASDSIRRELEYAKTLGKPVVVSMGAVAASGGYCTREREAEGGGETGRGRERASG